MTLQCLNETVKYQVEPTVNKEDMKDSLFDAIEPTVIQKI